MAILERLNPILEPQGSLLLTENVSVNGEPIRVIPHEEFRLFLLLDSNGIEKLSQTIRNKCYELNLTDNIIENRYNA